MRGGAGRRTQRPWSMYWRLTLGVLVVTVMGVFVADFVSVVALSKRMNSRVDQQITGARDYVHSMVESGHQLWPGGTPPNGVVMVVDGHGQVLQKAAGLQTRITPLKPCPPAVLRAAAATGRAFSVRNAPYRAAVSRLSDGRFLVVAQMTTETTAAVRSLVMIEAIAGVSLVAVVVVGTLWSARRTLAPIEQVTHTARQITRGDLSHRVDQPGSPREAVRLADSFNGMLQRIEEEFTRRRKAEQQLRDFVAGASHELRTPLTAIAGYSQLVRFGAADDQTTLDQIMRRVQQETDRMTELVDELLLLARLDQGRPLERQRVNLAELCADAMADLRVLAPDRALSLVVEPAEHVLEGDPNRLRQVVANLLGNCLTHTPPGTPVELRLCREGGMLIADVVDEGPGVPEELREQIFERFFRGPRSVGGTGTGLGLSIVTAIVAAHGGSVTVEPSEHGAWFRVRLPAKHRTPNTAEAAILIDS